MPADEGVSSGDWDGTIRSRSATPWVPEGLSLWEASVNKSPGAKANEDYGKRLETPDKSPTADCTYVQAILRPWTKRSQWASDRSGEGRWRDVIAYGLDDMALWLEEAPITWAWLSERVGLNPYGMRTADGWWESWSGQTDPPTSADLVLSGRDEQRDQLLERFQGSGLLTVNSASVEEALSFVTSGAIKAGDPFGSRSLARMAFVDELTTWRRLLDSSQPLVLVPTQSDFAAEAPSASRHLIIVHTDAGYPADIQVPPVEAQAAAAELQRLGLDEQRARELGRLARRSFTAFRRTVAVKPELHQPDWARGPVSRVSRSALLAGSWSEATEADKSVLVHLSGEDYEDVREELGAMAAEADPLIAFVPNSWHLVSPYDSWMLLASSLSEDDIGRFEQAVLDVLGEADPALELPREDQWMAAVRGKARRHSGDLRRGLARSLVLLAIHGDSTVTPRGTGSDWAGYLVAQLLTEANGDSTGLTWSGLADVLPLLAEAGPDRFIDATRTGLSGEESLLASLFHDDEWSLTSPGSPHTALIWALEGLAWSPDHFGAAVDLMGRLDSLDPRAEKKNGAAESIARIFCPWFPETSASPERRLDVLDALRNRFPECAWQVMMDLMPALHGTHFPTHEPRYRDWKPGREAVSNVEYFSFIGELVSRVLTDSGSSVDRWLAVFESVSNLHPAERARVVAALDSLVSSDDLTEAQVAELWEPLSDLVRRHRAYSDAKWALPEEALEPLDEIVAKLQPTSPVLAGKWLFNDHMPDLPSGTRINDRPNYEAELEGERTKALGHALDEGGLEAVLQLIDDRSLAWTVGVSLADVAEDRYESEMLALLADDDAGRSGAAYSYFARLFEGKGWDWLEPVIADPEVTSDQAARLLLSTRDFPRAWEVADTSGEGTADEFWTRFGPYGLGGDFEYVEVAAERMLGVGRNSAALYFLAIYLNADQIDSTKAAKLVVRGLEGLAAGGEDPDAGLMRVFGFTELFDLLERHRDEIGDETLGRLEWQFLQALGHEPKVPTLHTQMSSEAAFFVEVLLTVFPVSHDEGAGSSEDQEQLRLRATNGYHLLASWDRPPGVVDGVFEASVLKTWIDNVSPMLRDADRFETGIGYLATALLSVPADDDGAWPPRDLRDLLEELQLDELDNGLRRAIYNSRGVTGRGLEDGGAQESSLASTYRQQATAFADSWPRTAAILRSIADGYESEGRRNENQAERFRQGFEG